MWPFTPNWESKNPEIRLQGLNELNPDNPDQKQILEKIAINDNIFTVRQLAFKILKIEHCQEAQLDIINNAVNISIRKLALDKISDQNILADIAKSENYEIAQLALLRIDSWNLPILKDIAKKAKLFEIRKKAYEKLRFENSQDALTDMAKNESNWTVRKVTVEKLSNQSVLADIAKNDENTNVRLAVIEKLTDQFVLADIAKNDETTNVRLAAIEKLTDQFVLADIAKNDENTNVRLDAVKKLNDLNVLEDIAQNDKVLEIRQLAYKILGKENGDNALIDIIENAKDNLIRKIAINKLTDQYILAKIAKNDKDETIRLLATQKLTDQKFLINLAKKNKELKIRTMALKKIINQSVLIDIAKNDKVFEIRQLAYQILGKENSDNALIDIIENAKDVSIRKTAINKLTDQYFLAKIAKEYKDKTIRMAAIMKLTDQKLINNLAKKDKEFEVRTTALKKLIDQNVLTDIAKNDKIFEIRQLAYQILGKENSDNALIDIIENAKDVPTRKTAISKLTDQFFLAKIAKNVNFPSVIRIEAIKKLTDHKLLLNITNDPDYNIRKNVYIKLGLENTPESLADIAKHDSDYYIRKQAIEKLINEVELENIAANDKDFEIRQLAYKMLKKENTEEALTDIALFSKSNDERIKALTKISDQNLIKIIKKCNDNFIQVTAVLYLANPVPFLQILIIFLNTRESWDSPKTRDKAIEKLKFYSDKLSSEGKLFLLNQTKATNPKKHYDYQQSCFDGKYSNHVDSYGY